MKKWVFLSPHFDDVVLSAGGLVWELVNRGDQVDIWTICAGDPAADRPLPDYAQMLHVFWELGETDVPLARSKEDAAGCKVLGAQYRRYTVPDCIYRYYPGRDQPIIAVPDDIKGQLEPTEAYLIPPVVDFLRKNMPDECELVVPLTIGHHRDHVLTRKAAEQLGIQPWYYADYPYVVREEIDWSVFLPARAEQFSLQVSAAGLKAWQDGFACHHSQIVLFWADETEMRQAIESYAICGGGSKLWKF